MTIKGVVYPLGDPSTAAGMVEARAFQDAFDSCISSLDDSDSDSTKAERFTANLRRLHTHVNPYNFIILFLLRSNTDLKPLLSDSNAKGIFTTFSTTPQRPSKRSTFFCRSFRRSSSEFAIRGPRNRRRR